MQMQVFTAVGPTLNNLVKTGGLAGVAAKGAVHGVIGGALSIARGGNFQQGFISSAIAGGISGITTGEGSLLGSIPGGEGIALRTAISAAAGCAASSSVGGKCANGAVTAAFGHLYNSESQNRFSRRLRMGGCVEGLETTICGGAGGGGLFGGGANTTSRTAREALRNAKDANGIPRNAQPDKIIKPDTPAGDRMKLDNRNVKAFEFTNSKGQKVIIRQDRATSFGQGGRGNQPPHFNAGPKQDHKLRQHHFIVN